MNFWTLCTNSKIGSDQKFWEVPKFFWDPENFCGPSIFVFGHFFDHFWGTFRRPYGLFYSVVSENGPQKVVYFWHFWTKIDSFCRFLDQPPIRKAAVCWVFLKVLHLLKYTAYAYLFSSKLHELPHVTFMNCCSKRRHSIRCRTSFLELQNHLIHSRLFYAKFKKWHLWKKWFSTKIFWRKSFFAILVQLLQHRYAAFNKGEKSVTFCTWVNAAYFV